MELRGEEEKAQVLHSRSGRAFGLDGASHARGRRAGSRLQSAHHVLEVECFLPYALIIIEDGESDGHHRANGRAHDQAYELLKQASANILLQSLRSQG